MTQSNSDSDSKTPILIILAVIALIIAGVVIANSKGDDGQGDSLASASSTQSKAEKSAEQELKAAEMMKTSLTQEAEKHKKEMAALNERLAQEQKARKEAEAAAGKLENRIQSLKNALSQAEAKRKELQAKGQTNSSEYHAVLSDIEKTRKQLGQSGSAQKAAAARSAAARRSQIETEEAILGKNGKITLSDYVILSRNYKRRDKVLWEGRYNRVNASDE